MTTFTDDDEAVLLLTARLAGKEASALRPGMRWVADRVVQDSGSTPGVLLTDSLDASLSAHTAEGMGVLRRMGDGHDFSRPGAFDPSSPFAVSPKSS